MEKGQTLFTSPVSLIVGLEESLKLLLENGLDPIYRKQWALTMLTRTGVTALGLELFAPQDFAWGITSVRLPAGVDGNEVVRLAAERHGVYMAGGQDHLKGRIVRIGHMGRLGRCAGGSARAGRLASGSGRTQRLARLS